MQPKNQAVIVHVVNSLSGGGLERTLVAQLRGFECNWFQHIVVPLREAGRFAADLPNHVSCRPLAATYRSWFGGFRLAKFVSRLGAAILHARGTGCWMDACVAAFLNPSVRVLLGFHGLDRSGPLTRRQRLVSRLGNVLGATFVSVSESGRSKLCDECGISSSRIVVIPNGVNPSRFTPNLWIYAADSGSGEVDRASSRGFIRETIRNEFSIPDRAFVIGTVGSLTSVKRHNLLIKSLAEIVPSHPRLHVLIVGEGLLFAELQHQVAELGMEGHVHFAGWRDDVSMMLTAMDGYACCSDSEGMNNALLEAMSAGLPCIATNVGDNAGVIRHGVDGIIVEADDEKAIREAIQLLLHSPGTRRFLGDAARSRAGAFDFRQSVGRHESLYRELTADEFHSRRSFVKSHSLRVFPPEIMDRTAHKTYHA